MSEKSPTSKGRRSFVTGLNAGAASIAAVALSGVALAQTKQAPSANFTPQRHDADNWLDEIPGKHRMVFDTIEPNGFGEALLFAGNYFIVNRSSYGLQNSDLAVIVVARHLSTAFAYNDAMWTKYGTPMAAFSNNYQDPKTKAVPVVNPFAATLDSLSKQGVQFAACAFASGALAGIIARAVGGNAGEITRELTANLVPNARMVPAGIVAVNRAQERGYSLVSA